VRLGLVTVWVALTVAFYTPYPFGFWLAAVAFGLYLAAHLAPVPTQRAERRSPGVGPAARATVAEGVEEA
jgi:hypothetical protein